MSNAYRCNNCNSQWQTKKTFELHNAMCNLIHTTAKEREIDHNIEIPSPAAMFQYIIHLTNKCETLEKKVAKIQTSTTKLRRKHIDEYLQMMQAPKMSYTEWLSSIEVADYHLQKVFEHNLEECIKQILTPLLSEMPIRAFTQNANTFYVYDKSEWRTMLTEEFTAFIVSISRKVLRTYTKWSQEHHEEMHINAKMQELEMLYIKKVNGFGSSPQTRAATIKKWMFSKIAVSLDNVEF